MSLIDVSAVYSPVYENTHLQKNTHKHPHQHSTFENSHVRDRVTAMSPFRDHGDRMGRQGV